MEDGYQISLPGYDGPSNHFVVIPNADEAVQFMANTIKNGSLRDAQSNESEASFKECVQQLEQISLLDIITDLESKPCDLK